MGGAHLGFGKGLGGLLGKNKKTLKKYFLLDLMWHRALKHIKDKNLCRGGKNFHCMSRLYETKFCIKTNLIFFCVHIGKLGL